MKQTLNMKQTLKLVIGVLVALAFNIEWTWHPTPESVVNFGGPPVGIALCGLVCLVLLCQSFLALQDFLIARRYLAARITTALDLLPWIVLLPIAIRYIARGKDWVFQWGVSELKFWYYLALVATLFILQGYTLIRRIADNAKRSA